MVQISIYLWLILAHLIVSFCALSVREFGRIARFGELFLLHRGEFGFLVLPIYGDPPLLQNVLVASARGHDLFFDAFGKLYLFLCDQILVQFGGLVIKVLVTLYVEFLFVQSKLVPSQIHGVVLLVIHHSIRFKQIHLL